jgi:hypothetical protein
MRHRFILGVSTVLTVTSIAIGAITSATASPTFSAAPTKASSTPSTHKMNGKTADPNLTAPFLSEDRYVDGAWTTPVTPIKLPHASGEL